MVFIWCLYCIYMVFATYPERRQIEFSCSAHLSGTKINEDDQRIILWTRKTQNERKLFRKAQQAAQVRFFRDFCVQKRKRETDLHDLSEKINSILMCYSWKLMLSRKAKRIISRLCHINLALIIFVSTCVQIGIMEQKEKSASIENQ